MKFGIELVGAEKFDLNDSDWPCYETWEPNPRGLSIPEEYSGNDWETCLARMTSLVTKCLEADGQAARNLKAVQGVGIGFVDGDMHVIWARPSPS